MRFRASFQAGLPILASLCLAAAVAVSPGLAVRSPQDSPDQVKQGGEIYGGTCAACHGTDLSGGRGPSLFNPKLLESMTDAQIHAIVLDGVSGTEMPPFKGSFTDAQIDAVIAYLHARSAELAKAQASGGAAARALDASAAKAPDPDGQRIHSEKVDFKIETVVKGLETSWAIDFLPDGRLLVTERPGRLRIVDKSGNLLPDPVEGLPRIRTGQDAGLLDVAVGPDYAKDGWIYLAYVEEDPKAADPPPPPPGTPEWKVPHKPSMTVIVRGRIDAGNHWVQQQDVFRAPYSLYTGTGIHYGSRMAFDGKGHLFFTLGERGDMKNAQDLHVPLGKIHRVNLDGSIPADNPFAGKPGLAGSVWSYGHRNPQGLAIDPATHLLWESEHGPIGGDEINVIKKGANYGWGVISMGVQPGITRTYAPGMEQPVAWYFPTIAPTDIMFYEGDRYPGWKGSLFVCSLRGQQLRRLTVSGGVVTGQEIVFQDLGRIRAVTTGPDGLIYLAIQAPTGPGTPYPLSASTAGEIVRLDPIAWEQPGAGK